MPDKAVFVVEDWPGIVLNDDAQDEGLRGARDARNVMIEAGMLRARNGFTDITTSDFGVQSTGPIGVLQGITSGEDLFHSLVVFENGTLRGGRRSGTSLAASVAGATAPSDFAQMGDVAAGQSRLYITNTVEGLRTYVDLTGFSAVIGSSPKAFCLEHWEAQNRLVAANLNDGGGAGGNTSTVKFSAVGDGDTFGATDYVDLHPRDGDFIRGLCNWRDRMFVFKSRRFYVFYTVSEDPEGAPVFDYQTVDVGIGLHAIRGMCAAPEGVYFVGDDGIYLSNGSTPQKVSGALDPIFEGGLGADDPRVAGYTGPQLTGDDRTDVRLAYLDGVVYAACPDTSNSSSPGVLAYHTQTGRWTWMDFGGVIPELSVLESQDRSELIFTRTGRKRIESWVPAATTNDDDADLALVDFDYVLSGLRPVREEGEVIIRRSALVGSGSADLAVGADGDFAAASATLDLSGANEWQRGWDVRSVKGRSFNSKISGAHGTFVRRLEHHVAHSRRPNVASET